MRVGEAVDVEVDGHLDEPAWDLAPPVSELTRFQPVVGGPPPGRTEVRFLQDDRYLYAGVRVTGADYAVRARVAPREDVNDDDQIGIYFDTFRDRRSGYIFYTNPLGVQQDFRRNGDRFVFTWDAVFDSDGRRTDDGYEIELRWPWRSLKYRRGAREWGVMITRKIPSEGSKYGFPTLVRGHPQWFAQAAPLVGLDPPRRGSGLELLPQLTGVVSGVRSDEGLVWAHDDRPTSLVRPSLDVRFGVTPNLGFAATINPDFSQVEYDVTPIDLNQRFAFSFQETRPFFLDGAEYLDDGVGTLYTRGIASPWAGAKLSGREGRFEVGALAAVDRAPPASVHEDPTPGFTANDAEHATGVTSFARVARDVRTSGSVAVTALDRRLIGWDGLRGAHDLVGVDTRVPIAGRWTAYGARQDAWTGAPGDARWGAETRARLSRASGVGTGFDASIVDRTAGFRREAGFLNQSGLTTAVAALDHTVEPAGDIDTYKPSLRVEILEERRGDATRRVTHAQELVVGGVTTVDGFVEARRQIERGASVDGWGAGAGLAGQFGRTLVFTADVEGGRRLDFRRLAPVDVGSATLTATVRPTPGIRLDLSGFHQILRPTDEILESGSRLRLRANGQLTRQLGVRLVGEWTGGSARDAQLLTSILGTWLLHPGTAVWVGYAERTTLEGPPKALNRSAFVKASWLFRL